MCHNLRDGGRGSLATHVDNAWPVAALTAGIEAIGCVCIASCGKNYTMFRERKPHLASTDSDLGLESRFMD